MRINHQVPPKGPKLSLLTHETSCRSQRMMQRASSWTRSVLPISSYSFFAAVTVLPFWFLSFPALPLLRIHVHFCLSSLPAAPHRRSHVLFSVFLSLLILDDDHTCISPFSSEICGFCRLIRSCRLYGCIICIAVISVIPSCPCEFLFSRMHVFRRLCVCCSLCGVCACFHACLQMCRECTVLS